MAGSSRQWGWHRLDPRWARRLVADARLPRGATVLDVGAGLGAITGALLESDPLLHVIAVEWHPGRVAALRERFGGRAIVVRADAADLRLPRRPFHVVANPPFALGTALLRRLVHPGSRLVTAHVVLQQPVVRRWASPSAPALARWGRTFAAAPGTRVPRHAFHPPPHVDARVLVVRRR